MLDGIKQAANSSDKNCNKIDWCTENSKRIADSANHLVVSQFLSEKMSVSENGLHCKSSFTSSPQRPNGAKIANYSSNTQCRMAHGVF